jgi:RNA polymerase sigma-70 factor (ECF subfamily)
MGGLIPSPEVGPSVLPASADELGAERVLRFRVLFDTEFAYVWTSLRRLGVPARDLEDVTHEVLLEVYRNLDRYDPARPLRPWLFAFAFRFASDYRRLARHRVEIMDDTVEAVSLGAPADEAIATREARLLVARALEGIPLDRRAVFVLYELEECAMSEIAGSLEIPLHTAYSRLRVAREEFQSSLERLQRSTR